MSAGLPDADDSLLIRYADRLHKSASESKNYGRLYETAACLCDVLSKKLLLAKKTHSLYEKGDKQGLLSLAQEEYTECIRLVDDFHKAFRRQWYAINKTYGFEIHDARLGGLTYRLESCKERLIDYANGEITEIEELREPLLPYKDTYVTSWREMISANLA
jgi:hypothetical protein